MRQLLFISALATLSACGAPSEVGEWTAESAVGVASEIEFTFPLALQDEDGSYELAVFLSVSDDNTGSFSSEATYEDGSTDTETLAATWVKGGEGIVITIPEDDDAYTLDCAASDGEMVCELDNGVPDEASIYTFVSSDI